MTCNKVFVNLTNHPVAKWSQAQVDAALALGYDHVVDVIGGMPNVPPAATRHEVQRLAKSIMQRAMATVISVVGVAAYDAWESTTGLAVQGEPTLCYALASMAAHWDAMAYAATTDRKAVEVVAADGTVTKTSVFEFVQWRAY